MGERNRLHEYPISNQYTFVFIHPSNYCIAIEENPDLKEIKQSIEGRDFEAAQVIAENNPPFCDGCRNQYLLNIRKLPPRKSSL